MIEKMTLFILEWFAIILGSWLFSFIPFVFVDVSMMEATLINTVAIRMYMSLRGRF